MKKCLLFTKPSFQTDVPKRLNNFFSSKCVVMGVLLNDKEATGRKLSLAVQTPATE